MSVKLVAEAGVGHRRGRRRQGARGRRPHRRGRRRHRGQPALLDQERGHPVGARAGRDAAGARHQRAARPGAGARGRRHQDRPRRRHRGAARCRRGLVRHRVAARRGLPDGAHLSLDTCPVGIATQRPELRAKFAATPEMVENYLLLVAEEVRRHLAALGCAASTRPSAASDLLQRRHAEGRAGDLARSWRPARAHAAARRALRRRPRSRSRRAGRRSAGAGAPPSGGPGQRAYAIRTTTARRRAARRRAREGSAPRTAGRPCALRGAAGQSFGAFLPAGVELDLEARRTTTSARA